MTGFFDSLNITVSALVEDCAGNDELFLSAVDSLEDTVTHTVSRATGDREFPEEWRERIQSCLAVCRLHYHSPVQNRTAIDYLVYTRCSKLFGELHSLFHRLAAARIETRFGLLTDSPSSIVARRDAFDAEPSS